ncbi:MAG TPA: hypothetical protein VFN61_07000 [Acidimicrobiales bacterium]|nr:hypothetical protein [Acidimicrobiales bacterium]
MGTSPHMDGTERVEQRAAEMLPEERGSDDPQAMARAVLADSDQRQADREAAPGSVVEHRRSEDT